MGAAGAWLPKFKDRQVRAPGFSAFTFCKELLPSSRLAAFDGSLLLLSVSPYIHTRGPFSIPQSGWRESSYSIIFISSYLTYGVCVEGFGPDTGECL